MSSNTDKYRDWDAAYVMGSLAPSERREYEQHCADCPDCSRALSSLAGITGILATVPTDRAIALLPENGGRSGGREVPASLLPRVVSAANRARFRTRARMSFLAVGAAAAVAVGVIAVVNAQDDDVRTYAMEQTVDSPVTAETRLIEESWGTRIEITCWYAESSTPRPADAPKPPFEYALYVTDEDGNSVEQATWLAGPGSVTTPTATTKLSVDEIASIDIRFVPRDVIILETRP